MFLIENGVINYNNKKKLLLLCHQQKLNIWQLHEQQILWLLSLVGNIGVPRMKCIVICDNNQSYIIFHARMQHIDIHHHLVQEKIEENFVKLVYYNIENMVVDISTKGFFVENHEHFQHLMGMVKRVI